MRIVIQSSYGNLEAHGSQFTGFHFSGQSLQGSFHKQGYALDNDNITHSVIKNKTCPSVLKQCGT